MHLTQVALLRYQITKRSYGALSTSFRKRCGWVDAPPVDKPPLAAFLSIAAQPPVPPPATTATALSSQPKPHDDDTDASRERRYRWARLIARTWLEDPSLCPTCGKEMKILAAISSPAQDDVIERILRSRGGWDPPWKRRRPVRRPPVRAGPAAEPGHTTDSGPDFADYAVDPPGAEEG